MILSAHSQILKLDFKSIKKKLDTYIAILKTNSNIYGKRITPDIYGLILMMKKQ